MNIIVFECLTCHKVVEDKASSSFCGHKEHAKIIIDKKKYENWKKTNK